jgi:soluble lytic murein transglycosylase
MRVRLFRRFGRTAWAERERELLEAEMPVERRGEGLLCMGLPDLAIRVAIARGAAPLVLKYPRPYPEWISEQAAKAGVSAELVWALARRESLFDAGAVSGAGARGVLQMMESTARETSGRSGLPAGPLERADLNLALGIAHFRELGERDAWHLPAILAAYNAGVTKTEEWVGLFPDPDLFIERIGWRETRDYVRHVLDGYWTYRSGYPDDAREGGGP